jgi:antitoxin HicB
VKIEYPATITRDQDDNYLVEFIDLAEAFTEGESLDEALFNAAEVLTLCLEQRIADKQEIPDPSPASGDNVFRIIPDVGVQVALLVRKNRADTTLAELARSLETSWASVQRLENPTGSPSLKTLNRVAAALGKRLVVAFE